MVFPELYDQWIRRIASETTRGSEKEQQAIQILSYMWRKMPECKHWANVELERVKQEQLG